MLPAGEAFFFTDGFVFLLHHENAYSGLIRFYHFPDIHHQNPDEYHILCLYVDIRTIYLYNSTYPAVGLCCFEHNRSPFVASGGPCFLQSAKDHLELMRRRARSRLWSSAGFARIGYDVRRDLRILSNSACWSVFMGSLIPRGRSYEPLISSRKRKRSPQRAHRPTSRSLIQQAIA